MAWEGGGEGPGLDWWSGNRSRGRHRLVLGGKVEFVEIRVEKEVEDAVAVDEGLVVCLGV